MDEICKYCEYQNTFIQKTNVSCAYFDIFCGSFLSIHVMNFLEKLFETSENETKIFFLLTSCIFAYLKIKLKNFFQDFGSLSTQKADLKLLSKMKT